MLKILFSKPKVIFGGVNIVAAEEEGQLLAWCIPVINLRRYGLLGYFFKRNEAIECRVKVKFSMGNKLLYNFAEHWADSPIGRNLPADSSHHYIPLISKNSRGDNASLVGTPISTNSNIPPYKLPTSTQITADLEVISRKKVIARSRWLIDINLGSIDSIKVSRLRR